MFHGTELSPPAAPKATGAGAAPAAEGCVRSWARRLGPAGPLAAVMVLLPGVGAVVLVGFLHRLGPWLKSHESSPFTLAAAAAAATAGLAGFSLVPTYMLAIVTGWALGVAIGLPVAIFGLTAAATVGYGLSHLIVRGRVRDAVHDSPRCEAVRRAMLESGPFRAALIVTLLRLTPVMPFGATNLLMASAGCRVFPFVVGTALGSLPRTAAIVFMAAEMSQLNLRQQPGMIALSIAATVSVICAIGYLGRRALAQVTDGIEAA